jgi:hypothetical protein
MQVVRHASRTNTATFCFYVRLSPTCSYVSRPTFAISNKVVCKTLANVLFHWPVEFQPDTLCILASFQFVAFCPRGGCFLRRRSNATSRPSESKRGLHRTVTGCYVPRFMSPVLFLAVKSCLCSVPVLCQTRFFRENAVVLWGSA